MNLREKNSKFQFTVNVIWSFTHLDFKGTAEFAYYWSSHIYHNRRGEGQLFQILKIFVFKVIKNYYQLSILSKCAPKSRHSVTDMWPVKSIVVNIFKKGKQKLVLKHATPGHNWVPQVIHDQLLLESRWSPIMHSTVSEKGILSCFLPQVNDQEMKCKIWIDA